MLREFYYCGVMFTLVNIKVLFYEVVQYNKYVLKVCVWYNNVCVVEER